MKKSLCAVLLLALCVFSACTTISPPTGSSSESSAFGESAIDSVAESGDYKDSSEAFSVCEVESSSAENCEASAAVSADVSAVSSVPNENSSADVSQSWSESGDDISSGAPPQPPAPDKVFVSNGILISGTRGMEQFFGSVDGGTRFSGYVSEFKARLGDAVNVYSVVVPHPSCYYAPAGYEHLTAAGKRAFDNLKACAGESVKYVDLYSVMASHLDEPIYPRTECHWNALAAYYAAEAFAKSAGTPFPSLDTYTKVVKPGFVGSAYTFSKAAVLKNNPEDYVYYVPNAARYTAYFCSKGVYDFDNYAFKRDSVLYDYRGYAAFLGGIDTNSVKIETNANTGRKLVIFKDSYGNAFVPFVLSSFDEVYVVDIRYFNKNGVKFCQDLGATDLAFVVSGFTATGVVYKNIGRILNTP